MEHTPHNLNSPHSASLPFIMDVMDHPQQQSDMSESSRRNPPKRSKSEGGECDAAEQGITSSASTDHSAHVVWWDSPRKWNGEKEKQKPHSREEESTNALPQGTLHSPTDEEEEEEDHSPCCDTSSDNRRPPTTTTTFITQEEAAHRRHVMFVQHRQGNYRTDQQRLQSCFGR